MFKYLLLIPVLLSSVWGIVDIAPVEVGEKPGVSGNVALSFAEKTGNTEKDEYDLSSKVQYDTNKTSLFFIQGSYERTESGDTKIEDQKFVHGRYLHKLNQETLYAEAFVQYRQNIFKGIQHRMLLGGGLRWRVFKTDDNGKFYIGLGAFDEKIDYYPALVVDEDINDLRMNSYVAYKQKLSESAKFSLVAYYQPSCEHSDDFYTSALAELEVKIYKQFSLNLLYEVDYDSHPPSLVTGDVKKQDRVMKTALTWKF